MNPKVLILTQDFDPMADRLVMELRRRGVGCARFHTDGIATNSSVTISLEPSGVSRALNLYGAAVELGDVVSVWNRQQEPVKFPDHLSNDERDFARTEIGSLLSGFIRSADWFWVNQPDRSRYASHKPLQLQEAQRVGFEIPRTLISNDTDVARDFLLSCSAGAIYKTLYSPFFPGSEGLACFTSIVSEEHIRDIDSIRHTGGIFQEYVPKQFELRITVIGKSVFTVEIHSQEIAEMRVDWRTDDVRKLTHRMHALPPDIEVKCLEFLRRFGLVYAAIDMIVTPDGRYVFLECNPAGQYGWVEDLTGAPMSPAMAEMLIVGEPV